MPEGRPNDEFRNEMPDPEGPEPERSWYDEFREERRAARDKRKLAAAHADSRPLFLRALFESVATWRNVPKAHAPAWLEWFLRTVSFSAWGLVVVFSAIDAFRANTRPGQSVIFHHVWVGWIVAVVGLVLLVLILVDLATYRPELFALSSSLSDDFFERLTPLRKELKGEVDKVRKAPTTDWAQARKAEEVLLLVAKELRLTDAMRRYITLRTIFRLGALVAALSLVAYGLTTATSGGLIFDTAQNAPVGGSGLPQHIYYTLVSFFTIGFGDLHPMYDAAGYLFLALTVATFAAVAYFMLTHLVASQSEFRANMRGAAERFVIQHSEL